MSENVAQRVEQSNYFLIKRLLLRKLILKQRLFLMTDLNLSQRFGADVSFDENTKVLSINLNNLSNIVNAGIQVGLDVTGMTDANKDEYSSKILYSLIQLNQQNQPENNTDETVGLYVTSQGKQTINRNGVAQFGFRLVSTAYQNDNVGETLNPNNIGA